MKKLLVIPFLLILFVLGGVKAQDKLFVKGNEAYEATAYKKAIHYYEKFLEKSFKRQAVENLANSYRLVNDYPAASKWYKKLVSLKQVSPETYLQYGQMLMSEEKRKEAKVWFLKFQELKPDDQRAANFLADLGDMDNLYRDTSRYSVTLLDINSIESDFAPAFYKDKIVFSSSRPRAVEDILYSWDGQPFLDLWAVRPKSTPGKFNSPHPFRKKVNSKFHDATASFSADGTEIFFTRNNLDNGKRVKGEDGFVQLKIYYGDVEEGGWDNLRSLPFNSDDYSVGHPSLSYDGKVLFFISDMPGGFGGTDLYYSLRNGDEWSQPINLGAEINTPGNEMFPFIHSSNQLWFSSDGHGGLGGLDIFSATLDSTWGNITNPGSPINSAQDDFSVVLNPYRTYGLFASNRDGGKGSDDIYYFEVNRPVLEGIVLGKSDSLPVEGAKISFAASDGEVGSQIQSAETGAFSIWLEKDQSYKVTAIKENYYPFDITFHTMGVDDRARLQDTFWLEQPPMQLVGMAINPVDGSGIMDASVKLVKENTWMQTNEDGYFSVFMDPFATDRFEWKSLENPNCFQQQLPALCYRFFEEGMTALDTTQFAYMWDLGDGTQIRAAEVEYCYEKPGFYQVQLNMIDTLTGDIAFNEVTYNLEIQDPGKGYILSDDTLKLGEKVTFTSDPDAVKGCVISKYSWDFGDGTVGYGATVEHAYQVPGNYEVKLDLIPDPAEREFACENCVSKRVSVYAPETDLASMKYMYGSTYLDPTKDYFFQVTREGYVPTMVAYRPRRRTGFDTIKVELRPLPGRVMYKGVAFNTDGETPLRNVFIDAVNTESGETEFSVFSVDGSFSMPLRDTVEYQIEARKEGFLTQRSEPFQPDNSESENTPELRVNLDPVEIGRTFALNHIYYDYNESYIRPDARPELDKVIEFLDDNPKLVIELGSHTDSRGDDAYNLALSQARADAAVKYLIENGIEKDRVVAIGYGEQKPVNLCKNGVPCAEELHQQNRRTAFTIIGYGTEIKSQDLPVAQMRGEFKPGGYQLAPKVDAIFETESGGDASSATPSKTAIKENGQRVYSVQIALLSRPANDSYFDKLGEYRGALFEDKLASTIRYRVGNVKNFATARKHLTRIQNRGYEDAFMIKVNPQTGDAEKVDIDSEASQIHQPESSKESLKAQNQSNQGKNQIKSGEDPWAVNAGDDQLLQAEPTDWNESTPIITPNNRQSSFQPEFLLVKSRELDLLRSEKETYLVQVGAFQNVPDRDFFTGLGKYEEMIEREDLNGWIKYRVGIFETRADAEKAAAELNDLGYGVPFIIILPPVN